MGTKKRNGSETIRIIPKWTVTYEFYCENVIEYYPPWDNDDDSDTNGFQPVDDIATFTNESNLMSRIRRKSINIKHDDSV